MKPLIIVILLLSMSKLETNEPDFELIKKEGNIEIRKYPSYIVARTSIDKSQKEEDNNMFRVLAHYIFGGNTSNQSIPMTAPVITHSNDGKYDMIFFMLEANTIESLPIPNNKEISIEKMNIGKSIAITFGMWATDKRVNKYKNKLDKYVAEKNIEIISDVMVAQYNSPWTLPPFRKNELIYKIK